MAIRPYFLEAWPAVSDENVCRSLVDRNGSAPGRIRTSDSRFRNAPRQFLYHSDLSADTAYLRGFRRSWCFRFPAQFSAQFWPGCSTVAVNSLTSDHVARLRYEHPVPTLAVGAVGFEPTLLLRTRILSPHDCSYPLLSCWRIWLS